MRRNDRGSVLAETAMVLPTLLLITTLLLASLSAVNTKIRCEQLAANVGRAIEREEPQWHHYALEAMPTAKVELINEQLWTTVKVSKEFKWGIRIEGRAVALVRE